MAKERTNRALVVSEHFAPGHLAGGALKSVVLIVDTAPDDWVLDVVTSDRDLGQSLPYEGLSGQTVSRGHHSVTYLAPRAVGRWFRGARARGVEYDLMYLNSLFNRRFSILPLILNRFRVVRARRVLLAPRGELSPGALSLHAKRKRVALSFFKMVLHGRWLTWQASTEMEKRDILRAFPKARVLVAMDPVGLPARPLPPAAGDLSELRLVFISRISPMKNLDLAIRALADVRANVVFDIFGPIEDREYWQACLGVMESLDGNVTVRHRGPLPPEAVLSEFQHYDAFLFPTKGENFGHVISESLAASCPVICTSNTPWTDVLLDGGGWVVNDEASISDVIAGLCRASTAERLAFRVAAGEAYARWRQRVPDSHAFSMLMANR